MSRRSIRNSMMSAMLFLTCLGASEAAAQWDGPDIYNVRAHQRAGTNLVDIHFDMITVDWEPATVSAYLSIDGGQTYTVPCATG